MTRREAHREADRRWSTPGISDGDRNGTVCLRHKNRGALRCEVGYQTRGRDGRYVVMGRGATWEDAFGAVPACEGCLISGISSHMLVHTCGLPVPG